MSPQAWRSLRYALVVLALVLGVLLLLSRAVRAAIPGAILAACEEQLLGLAHREDHPERLAVCLEVGVQAGRDGAPVDLALALAWEEAKYQRTPRRMLGALQVSRGTLREMCRGQRHCGPIRAGVLKLAELVGRYAGDWRRAVCRYNAGGGPCREGWVSAVLQTAREMARRLAVETAGGPET